MERVTRGMYYLSDEFGGGVSVSEAQEDSTVEDRRVEVNAGEEKEEEEGGETKGDTDSKEREYEEEGEHKEEHGSESEKSESEIYTSGQGRHDVSISVTGDSGGKQYNGNEREGEHNGTGERGGEGGEGEKEQLTNGDRMLWSCGICSNTTVNIFARDDHIASRSHIRAARKVQRAEKEAGPLSPPQRTYAVPVWLCALCDEEMSVFLREEHESGKQHLRLLRKQQEKEGIAHPVETPDAASAMPGQRIDSGGRYDGAGALEAGMAGITFNNRDADMCIPPPAFASNEYQLRETFYCITCAAEFDLSQEDHHLADLETWVCTLCAKAMHPAAREIHLLSERHTYMASVYESQPDDLHCHACRKSYAPVEREGHIAGMEHQQAVARFELEQRYIKRPKDQLRTAAPKPPGPDLPLPHLQVAPAPVLNLVARVEEWGDPSACDLCDEPLLGIQLTTHRALHCPLTGPGGDLPKEPQGPPSKVPEQGGTANSSYFCSVCNRSPPNKYEHLQSKKHLKKAGNKGKHRAKPKSGVPSWAHTARRREMREGLLDREYCEVCSKRVAEMAQHVNSIKHRRNEAVKLSAAKQHGTGTPSTQVAHTQPGSPVYPQQVLSRQPPPIPPGLIPPQLPPQVVPQPVSRLLPPQVLRVTHNPVPCPVPRPAPEIQAVAPEFANSPYVRIMGDMFHCKLCERDRGLVGIEGHMKSNRHRRKVAAEARLLEGGPSV